jgi:preprotein translocase subunit SecB
MAEKQAEQQQPSFNIEKLYVKDLSLELPNAPKVFMEADSPQLDVQIHNESQHVADALYEVVVTVTVTAKSGDKTIYPYVREAISDLVTRGGFPPVLLAPVSFEALYVQRQQEAKGEPSRIEIAH